jgi:hypothetical protein
LRIIILPDRELPIYAGIIARVVTVKPEGGFTKNAESHEQHCNQYTKYKNQIP